jgi:hypothetical protein
MELSEKSAWRPLDSGPGAIIQIIRSNKPGDFSVRVTLYGKADKEIADRALIDIQREKRRHFHLAD